MTCKEEASLGSTLRAAGGYENPGGESSNMVGIIFLVVEIGLIDLLKSGGEWGWGESGSNRPDANYRSDLIIALSWLTRVIRHP